MSTNIIENKKRLVTNLKSTISELKNLYYNKDFVEYHKSPIHDDFWSKYTGTIDDLEGLLDNIEEDDPYLNDKGVNND